MAAKKVLIGLVAIVALVVLGWAVMQFGNLAGSRLPVSNGGGEVPPGAICEQSCGDFSGSEREACLSSCREFTAASN